jgi:hypothetical protein
MIKFSIPCNGGQHEIGLTEKGKLIFFNHTKEEIKSEEIIEKMTNIESSCKCLSFLKEWQKWNINKILVKYNLSKEIINRIDEIEKKKIKRYINQKKQKNTLTE